MGAHFLVLLLALWLTGHVVSREIQSHAQGEVDRVMPLILDDVAMAYAGAAAAAPTGPSRSGAPPNLAPVTRDATAAGLGVTITDLNGRVVAASDADGTPGATIALTPEIAGALADGQRSGVRVLQASEGPVLLDARTARVDGTGPVAIVRMSLPLRSVDSPLRGMRFWLVVIWLVLLGLAVAALWLVSRRVDARIDRLSDAADRFARADFGEGLDVFTARELGPLAEALNVMAAQLESRLDELQERTAEQRVMLESMSAGMIALDGEHGILRTNSRAITLLEMDTTLPLRGRLAEEVVRRPIFHRLLDDARKSDEAVEADVPVGERIVKVTVDPLIDPELGRVGMLVLATNATKLRRLERLRSEFAANVSHELRTPITSIKGYAETLLQAPPEDPERRERFLLIIQRNAERLESIIEDLLALAGLERRGDESGAMEMTTASAEDVVSDVIGQFEPEAVERTITLRAEIEPDLAITGGVQLVAQALSNLVSNAIRYGPEASVVTVRGYSVDDDWIAFAVRDEGPGIASEHHPRIFERFYRVDQARSRNLGGTGLGLAIVKHVAVAHGGRTEVISDPATGPGTEFRIILPRDGHVAEMGGGDPGAARRLPFEDAEPRAMPPRG
ncbi:MAG: ATP-binding protein [Phycisphaerales bacterium]